MKFNRKTHGVDAPHRLLVYLSARRVEKIFLVGRWGNHRADVPEADLHFSFRTHPKNQTLNL